MDKKSRKLMVIINDQGEEETRMWVSEEYGIPLRVENTDEEGTSKIEYKNLKTGFVPEDVFEIPQGPAELLLFRTDRFCCLQTM